MPVASSCSRALVADAVAGDANGDGAIDVSDSVYMERWLLSGGPAPFCDGALDVLNDDVVDIGDGYAILYGLFAGGNLPEKVKDDCTVASGVVPGACGDMGIAVVADPTVNGAANATASFPASVQVRSSTLAVQAWSFGVEAEGCTATLAGTGFLVGAGSASAERHLDAAGLRDQGFNRTDGQAGGVVSGVVLSWRRDVTLTAGDAAVNILNLDVVADVPTSGCGTCVLSITGDVSGLSGPVPVVLTAGGQSYEPLATPLTVQVCAD